MKTPATHTKNIELDINPQSTLYARDGTHLDFSNNRGRITKISTQKMNDSRYQLTPNPVSQFGKNINIHEFPISIKKDPLDQVLSQDNNVTPQQKIRAL